MKIYPFGHSEILAADSFDEFTTSFCITEDCTPKVLLLRSIVGSVKIRHALSHSEFDQRIDYLDLENRNQTTNPILRLKDYVSPELTMEDFSKYFSNKKFLYQNFPFFQRLNDEYNNYFYYENKNSHTTAFVYIYRILETISYAFPLIYASKTEDFKGTYDFLKKCLLINPDKDKGELGFFKSFVKAVFSEDPIFESSLTIEIAGESEEIQRVFFNAIKKACPENLFDSNDTEEPRKIAIKFSEYSSFIINVRNRFFHLFNSGQSNLQSD